VIAFILDITERKEAEDILRAHADELARSNADLNDFAYVASHDLQEPLHKIEAFGDMLALRLKGISDDEAKDYLGRMLKATGRMESLIQDLLTLARVTSRGKPMERVDLDDIAAGVLGDLETAISGSGARVEVGELPAISADATQMRQLLQNLIGNALKFRDKSRAPVVKVSGRDRGDGFAELVVEDNGIGFEESHRAEIFRPFRRLHSVRDYQGNGMGLAICERIALRHGGQVSAEAAPGQGARFTVVLPLARELEKRARETAVEESRHG
jgi:two-component system sensor kinase FixL